LNKFYKILFFAVFSLSIFFAMHGSAQAADYTLTSVTASPTQNRGYCETPNSLNGFAANISNVSFDLSSGTFNYIVNLNWGRCNIVGEKSRAYAIFGPPSFCPYSGSYGEGGASYDCVKYIGDPAYSRPSNLICGGSVDAACVQNSTAAKYVQQDPNWAAYNASESKSYALSYAIPNWVNVRSSQRSYTKDEIMGNYYKTGITNFEGNWTGDFLFLSVSASWVLNTPPPPTTYGGQIQVNKRGKFINNDPVAPTSLNINSELNFGQQLVSPDGSHKLVMQSDGNLVVYSFYSWLWQTGYTTPYKPGDKLIFQNDGNLVLYKGEPPNRTVAWTSVTGGKGGVKLDMQDDGNLVMYDIAGTAVWYSKQSDNWSYNNTNLDAYPPGVAANASARERYGDLANLPDNEVGKAKVTVGHTGICSSPWSAFSTAQSWLFNLWVNPCTQTSPTAAAYYTSIEVPNNYRVNRVQTSVGDTDLGTWTCTDFINKTGTCTLQGVTITNNTITKIDWFLEPIPQPILYYPWFKTTNGDITSSGGVSGQALGAAANSNDKRGARRAGTTGNAATNESSFVVAAATGTGNYFCSQQRFVLGVNNEANRNNTGLSACQTGGYTPAKVDFAKVKASIEKVWLENGAGAVASGATTSCNPKYATATPVVTDQIAQINTDLSLSCPAGGIQKITGPVSLPALKVSGRGTIWVTGNLTLNGDITYDSATNDPKTTANLVIFVDGDVVIDAGVTRIDASIISTGISTGNISTCRQSSEPGVTCTKQLVINGYLASKGKINFARRYFNQATPAPAELINLTGQATTFPPPGLDRVDTDATSKLQINSGELAPRLK